MANSILTPTAVTREALRILHQKMRFVGSVNRQYDDSYAKSGAKIGDTLKVRLPNQYTVRSGATLSTQDTTESSVSVTMGTQKGVDLTFTSAELTLSLDDFSKRILNPAMARLAAEIEADAFNMYKDVYQGVGTAGTTPATYLVAAQAAQKLREALAPDDDLSLIVNPAAEVAMADALKGLFQDGGQIASQYRDGMMGRTAGFDWYRSTLVPTHTVGNKVASVTVSGAGQTGASLLVGGVAASDTFKQGQIFTIAGVFRVHPETKTVTSDLQQFVVTADATSAGATVSLSISPSITTSGAYQTVSASPANSAALVFVGSASTAYPQNIAFHKDAFTFVTADLMMPQGVDFASRQTYDGLSMRVVRQYAISSDTFPCRIDVLYGYKTIRPQLACRITG